MTAPRDALAAAREMIEAARSMNALSTGLPWYLSGETVVIGPRGGRLAKFARWHDAEAAIGMRQALPPLLDLAAAGLALRDAVSPRADPAGVYRVQGYAVNAFNATLARVVGADTEGADHA